MFFLLPLVRLALPVAVIGGTGYVLGKSARPAPTACAHVQQQGSYCSSCGTKIGG